jgi:hypothetical protein
VIEAVISGASAASAATMPSNASVSPNLSPTRSRRETRTQLVARLTDAPTMKAAQLRDTLMGAPVAPSRAAPGYQV